MLFCYYKDIQITENKMLVKVTKIGNSKGIRLPKEVIARYNIKSKLEMELGVGEIIFKPVDNEPRKGWAEAFRKMHERKDDKLLIGEIDGIFKWEW